MAVKSLATERQAVENRLRKAIQTAGAQGCPKGDLAEAAGIHRSTLALWLKETEATP